MKSSNKNLWVAILAITVLGISMTPARAKASDDPDVIIEWNQILQNKVPPGLVSPHYYAMLHIAMFDAVNSIEGAYERYHVRVPANRAASAEAAAAQAAHDLLLSLIPAGAAEFKTALDNRLAAIEPWRAALGVAVGRKVGKAMLDWRAGDGFGQPNPAYVPPALPGLWQPTPPGFAAAAFVNFGSVEPFGLLTPTQFLPDPLPLLNSAEYATDLEYVKEIGSINSASRTREQTLVGRLFAGAGYTPTFPFPIWNNVGRDVARSQHLSLIKTARLFALLNASIHDGLQTSHTSKYIYGLWRPITAIQRAGEDLNDLTTADLGWMPLVNTPPYPSHSSNLTCVGASAARTLARVLHADAIPFTVSWTGTGGNANVTRSYAAFSDLAVEGGLARVYAGIHFPFELTASHKSCRKVADYIVDHYARRRW